VSAILILGFACTVECKSLETLNPIQQCGAP
jgi:hypothetical protein